MTLSIAPSSISKFNTFSVAVEASETTRVNGRSFKKAAFQGDDGLFWVVTGRNVRILLDVGYEMVAQYGRTL